jgi:TetR/AcrR family transcriptional repressor of nem operon
MNKKREQKELTRAKILEASDQLFKKNGYVATGIDSVMAKAGLTAGGFYSHFASKEKLFSEMIDTSLRKSTKLLFEGLEDLSGKEWLKRIMRRYLSKYHRDELLYVCALPTLTIEISRNSKEVKNSFENILLHIIDYMEEKIGPDTDINREKIYSLISICMSGIILSRSISDPELSDNILNSCLEQTYQIIGD